MTQEAFYARLDSFMDAESTFSLIPPLITQAKAGGLSILIAFHFQFNDTVFGTRIVRHGAFGVIATVRGAALVTFRL